MDETVNEYDSSLPTELENSIQPYIFTSELAGHLELPDRSVPLIKKASTGQLSPLRARTMKEYDEQLNDLKKENFSLKLRIFYLQQRMDKQYGDGNDVYNTNIELKITTDNLKKDLEEKNKLLKKAMSAINTLSDPQQEAMNRLRQTHEEEIIQLKQFLESQINQKSQEVKDSEKTIQNMGQEINALRGNISDEQRKRTDLEEKLLLIANSRDEKDQLIKDLTSNLAVKEERLAHQICESQALTNSLKESKKQISLSTKENKDDVSKLYKKISDLEHQLEIKDAMFQEKDKLATSLADKLRDRDQLLKSMEDNLKAKEKSEGVQLKMIQGLAVAQKKKDKELMKRNEEFDEISKVRGNLEHLQEINIKEHEKLQSEICEKDSAINSLERHSEVMKEKMQNLESELSKEKQQNLNLEKDFRHAQERLLSLERELEDKEQRMQQFSISVKDKDRQLQQYIELLNPYSSESKNELIKQQQMKIKELENQVEMNHLESSNMAKDHNEVVNKLRQKLHDNERKFNSLLKEAEDNLNTLEAEREERSLKVRQLALSLKTKDKSHMDEFETYNRILAEKDAKIISLKQSLDDKSRILEEAITKSLDNDAAKLDQLKEGFAIKDKMIEDIVSEKNRVEEILRRTNQEMSLRIQQRDSEYSKLQSEYDNETQMAERRLRDVLNEKRKLEAQIEELQMKVTEFSKIMEEIPSKHLSSIAEKERTIESLLESSSEKEQLVAKLQTELLKSQSELQRREVIKSADGGHYGEMDNLHEQFKECLEELQERKKTDKEIKQALNELTSYMGVANFSSRTEDIVTMIQDLKSRLTSTDHADTSLSHKSENNKFECRRMYDLPRNDQPIYINVNQTSNMYPTNQSDASNQCNDLVVNEMVNVATNTDCQSLTSVENGSNSGQRPSRIPQLDRGQERRRQMPNEYVALTSPDIMQRLLRDARGHIEDLERRLRSSEALVRSQSRRYRSSMSHDMTVEPPQPSLRRCLSEPEVYKQIKPSAQLPLLPIVDYSSFGKTNNVSELKSQVNTLRTRLSQLLSNLDTQLNVTNNNSKDLDTLLTAIPKSIKANHEVIEATNSNSDINSNDDMNSVISESLPDVICFDCLKLNNSNNQLMMELSRVNSANLEQRSTIEELTKFVEELIEKSEAMTNITKDSEHMKRDNAQLSSANDDLSCQMSDLILTNERLKQKISTYETLQSSNNKLTELNDSLEATVKQLQLKVANYEDDLQKMVAIQTQRDESIVVKSTKILDLESRLKDVHETLALLKTEILTKEKELSNLNEMFLQKNALVEKLGKTCQKLESSFKTSTYEVNRLKQQLANQNECLNESTNLNRTLRYELDCQSHLVEIPATGKELDLRELLSEIRHLRVQLERCIESNNCLRKQLELSQRAASPNINGGDASDGMPCEDAGDITSRGSLSTMQANDDEVKDSKLNISMLSSIEVARSAHSSPATSRFFTNRFIGIDNISPRSTLSERGMDVPDQSSPRERNTSLKEMSLWAVLGLDDYELLKRENDMCRVSISGLTARIQDRLSTLRQQTPLENIEYSTLKELASSTENLRVCLLEESRLLSQFHVSEIPSNPAKLSDLKDLENQNDSLRDELSGLIQKYRALQKYAQSAYQRLKDTNYVKEKSEQALGRNLKNTEHILSKAKENLARKFDVVAAQSLVSTNEILSSHPEH